MGRKAKEIAEMVHDAILEHREDVPGRDSGSPHLYNDEIVNMSGGGYKVRFWSSQGFFHDCWITAKISSSGIVTFNHCNCKGMKQLVRLVRDDI